MLKIISSITHLKPHFRQIQNKGERFQWADKATDALKILAPIPDPWGQEWEILIRLNQGKTRAGITYPRNLDLLCLPPSGEDYAKAQIIRERWKGNFAHSDGVTLLFFAFPVAKTEITDQNWLMISIK